MGRKSPAARPAPSPPGCAKSTWSSPAQAPCEAAQINPSCASDSGLGRREVRNPEPPVVVMHSTPCMAVEFLAAVQRTAPLPPPPPPMRSLLFDLLLLTVVGMAAGPVAPLGVPSR